MPTTGPLKLKVTLTEIERSASRWMVPSAPQTMTRGMRFHFEPQKRPTRLKVYVELDSRGTLDYKWTITTALPSLDQTHILDEEVTAENSALFILRTIRAFSSLISSLASVVALKLRPTASRSYLSQTVYS